MRFSIFEKTWAVFDLYRKLGVPSENIFVIVGLNVVVEARNGDKVFSFDVGMQNFSEAQFNKMWVAFCEELSQNKIPNERLKEISDGVLSFKLRYEIARRMQDKGVINLLH